MLIDGFCLFCSVCMKLQRLRVQASEFSHQQGSQDLLSVQLDFLSAAETHKKHRLCVITVLCLIIMAERQVGIKALSLPQTM